MFANPISTVSLMLTLAGLVGSFFSIQLSQWLRDLIALQTKTTLNKAAGNEAQMRAIFECKAEYKKLTNASTYLLHVLITLFVCFILWDALVIAAFAKSDPIYPNVKLALEVFFGFFVLISLWLIGSGACTAIKIGKDLR
jgi:hypothetical protein